MNTTNTTEQTPSVHEQTMSLIDGLHAVLTAGEHTFPEFQARIQALKFLTTRLNKLNDLEMQAAALQGDE